MDLKTRLFGYTSLIEDIHFTIVKSLSSFLSKEEDTHFTRIATKPFHCLEIVQSIETRDISKIYGVTSIKNRSDKMNQTRRTEIRRIIKDLQEIEQCIQTTKVKKIDFEDMMDTLDNLQVDIDWLAQDEQEAFDNLPESLQYSMKAETIEENAALLQDLAYELSYAVEACNGKDVETILNILPNVILQLTTIL